MHTRRILTSSLITIILFFLMTGSAFARSPQASVLGTGFTYQGQLKTSGTPFTGTCDFQFALYDAEISGSSKGELSTLAVPVSQGYFTVTLDFGATAFNGDARWMEIWLRCPAGSGDYSVITPRQAITAAPYALYSNAVPWSGITTMPAGFADGVDDNTTYTAGSGLTLAAGAFSVDPTYVQRRVGTACGANSSISSIAQDGTVTCDTDNDTVYTAGTGLSLTTGTFSVNPTYVQRRVSSACAAGSAIKAIAQDGTVTCEDMPHPPAFTLSTPDSTGYMGEFTSIEIGTDGLGLISYYDYNNYDLKITHCNDTNCSSATASTLYSTDMGGWLPSIAIGTDGLGLISFYEVNNYDLKVAHCSNVACSAAAVSTLDSTGDVGTQSSIDIGTDGLGLISYNDYTNGDLKVAHCSNTACSTKTLSTPDSTGTVGQFTSLAIGADGLGLISYYDATNGDLKVAHCSNTACSTATLFTLDSTGDVGQYTSIAIGTDGLGLISYHDAYNSDLKVAHCNDTACSTATTYTLDSSGVVGWYTSIEIGADGLGLISYWDGTNGDLKVAHCTYTACSAATVYTLDSTGNVGSYLSLAIGADDLGLISYYDGTNFDLKVAHCGNRLCNPNW